MKGAFWISSQVYWIYWERRRKGKWNRNTCYRSQTLPPFQCRLEKKKKDRIEWFFHWFSFFFPYSWYPEGVREKGGGGNTHCTCHSELSEWSFWQSLEVCTQVSDNRNVEFSKFHHQNHSNARIWANALKQETRIFKSLSKSFKFRIFSDWKVQNLTQIKEKLQNVVETIQQQLKVVRKRSFVNFSSNLTFKIQFVCSKPLKFRTIRKRDLTWS